MTLSIRRGTAGPPSAARTEWAPRPVPWGGVVARLRAATTTRRLLPTGLALVGTDLLCRATWSLSASRRTEAIERAAAIVAGTSAEADLTRVARDYVAARARGWELSWRPWELERVPIRGRERVTRARATGRGVIISHTHLGPLAAWVPLVRMLRPLLAPQGDWLLDEPTPGYNGYQVEHWRKIYQDAGAVMLHNSGSALRVYKTLRRGGSVLIALDVPGDRRTRFLGKPVDLDDGTAQLAAKTDALVVPAALMHVGRRWEIQISEALDPRDFDDPDDLHVALAAVHEELIMRAPEHLECPPLWLWGRVSRDGWFRE